MDVEIGLYILSVAFIVLTIPLACVLAKIGGEEIGRYIARIYAVTLPAGPIVGLLTGIFFVNWIAIVTFGAIVALAVLLRFCGKDIVSGG